MKRPSLLTLALAVLVVGAGIAGVVNAQALTPNGDSNTTAIDATDEHRDGYARVDAIVDRLQERYDLSDRQALELKALIVTMHADGATKAEIARAVADKLVDFGVPPEDLKRDAARLFLHTLSERFDLTERQTQELGEIITEMHADGASRAEIKRVVYAKLVEWDKIDRHPPVVVWMTEYFDLSDTEADQLVGVVADLKAQGASNAEIKRAVARQLVAFGFTPEEVKHGFLHYRLYLLSEHSNITEEQLRELHSMVHEMYENGASGAEIRHAVNYKVFHEWDLEFDRPVDHPRDHRARDRPADRPSDRAPTDRPADRPTDRPADATPTPTATA